jgi:hypothetical protein
MANPTLSPLMRVFALIVALVLIGGVILLLYPGLIAPRWPWQLTPFNARFLGAFYTAELVAILILAAINRWSPARLVLVMALSFTVLVSVVSLWHLDRFDFGRKGPWGWFFVYIGSAAAAGAFLWNNRNLPHPGQAFRSRALRLFYLAQAALTGGYGLALLLTPQRATAFWPWRVDAFHSQLYSAIFITAGVGAFMLSRAASRFELATFGLAQILLAIAIIAGTWVVNYERQAFSWTAPGALTWLALFAAIGIAGYVSVALSKGKAT